MKTKTIMTAATPRPKPIISELSEAGAAVSALTKANCAKRMGTAAAIKAVFFTFNAKLV